MNAFQLGFLALLFLGVFALALMLMARLGRDPVQQRLAEVGQRAGRPARSKSSSPWTIRLARWAAALGKLSAPEGGWEHSLIRTRFMNAGLRHPTAPALYFAAKTALATALPMLGYLLLTLRGSEPGNGLLFFLLMLTATGYYLPNVLLATLVRRRQRDIFEAFPDALDLMTVCVEAGLAVDGALSRVADEIGLRSQVLSDELKLVTLELRAGNPKDRALRNLAMRTGVDDVDALVAMLIQAERFGTSIAASLRVQSDQLRTKRRQRAEEQAAKIALKLLFPLIFFIFPTLLIVLMGPAFIQIYRVLLPGMSSE